jgi:ABC-type antimicrobial peptide transport system permease subunit
METPLIAGRDFSVSDTPTSPRKAIVNQAFTRKFFENSNPLGRTFHDAGKPDQTYLVTGIVKDSKYYTLRESPRPTVFVSFTQANGPEEQSTLVIRSNEAPPLLTASIRSAANQIGPGMVLSFNLLKTQIREGLLRERLMATLSGFYGVMATVLAMIGLYGVISYVVVRRRSEIGLRMALGASRTDILVMILRESAILLGAGLAIGVALEMAAGNVAASMLYGLKPRDPFALASAIAAMAVIAIAASLLPARRAATVDPMAALREE